MKTFLTVKKNDISYKDETLPIDKRREKKRRDCSFRGGAAVDLEALFIKPSFHRQKKDKRESNISDFISNVRISCPPKNDKKKKVAKKKKQDDSSNEAESSEEEIKKNKKKPKKKKKKEEEEKKSKI